MLYNKQSTSYKSLLFPETASKKDNKKNSVVYYEKDLDDAGDNTKSIVNKAIVQGNKEAEKKKISESEKPVYLDNYIKAQVAADNNLQLYNNAVINMAKSELKSGISNPSSKKATESLATMESKYIPMTEYVKSKDESDYKKRLFTTTKYADPVYSDELKEYQKKLNQAGITDKFGDSIDEDGLWGAQTISATKKLLEAAENANDIAKGILKEFDNIILKSSNIGKGIYMSNYFSPTEIEGNAFFGKKNLNGTDKKYSIELETDYQPNSNNLLKVYESGLKRKNNELLGLGEEKQIDNSKGNNYDVIKKSYKSNDLNNKSKELDYDEVEFVKNKINLRVSSSKANTVKVLKTANKVVDVGGKALFLVNTGYDVARIGKTIYDDIVDDNNQIDKKTVSTLSDFGGSWAGSALGASVGAKAGAALGTLIFPGAGTAIGSVLGGVIGGAIGAFCGGKGASVLSEKIYDEVVD